MIAAFSVLSAVESRERSLTQASSKDDVAFFFAVRLIAISALVLSPASASAQAKWGDVNGDGVVGAVDAQAILSAVVGLPLPTGFTKVNGDASCDGTLGAVDAQIVPLLRSISQRVAVLRREDNRIRSRKNRNRSNERCRRRQLFRFHSGAGD